MSDPEEKIRIFTALRVPEDISRRLLDLPGKGVQGRWNNWRDLHITMRFIGDIQAGLVPQIREDLKGIRKTPVDIEIEGLDFFETPRQPVLFADILSRRKLEALVTDITDRLVPYGIHIPERPYHPHITLARLKKTPVPKIKEYIRRHSPKIKASYKASHFYLIRSGRPDQTGSVYQNIETYPLDKF